MSPLTSLAPSRHYEPVLDGLRAVSIIFVVLRHFEITSLVSANLGVTIFFFISGFIITRLLLVEITEAGNADILKFWARRLVRLVPALYLMITTVVIISFSINDPIDWSQVASGFLYVMNYYSIWLRDSGGEYVLPINPLWSLAVEEHYYLIYPLIFLALAHRIKYFIIALGLAVLASLSWRVINVSILDFTPKYNYYATESRIDTILFGCLLTLAACEASRDNKNMKKLISICSQPWVFSISIAFILLSVFAPGDIFRHALRYTFQSVFLFFIFCGLLFSSASGIVFIRNILSMKPFIFLGRISYSLYLWHLPVAFYLGKLIPSMGPVYGWLSLCISIIVASASFYFFERPIIRAFSQRLRSGRS